MGSPALEPQEPTITSEMETTQSDDSMQKLTEYLRTLQDERRKVEAFKRELPLCMQLIDEAIESAKQRAMEDQCSPTASLQTSVLDAQISDSERSKGTENFMPLKRRWYDSQQKDKNCGQGSEVSHDSRDQHHKVVLRRPAWSGKAQLCTQQSECTVYEDSPSRATKRRVDFGGSEQARAPMTSSRLHLSSNHRQGGAFVPFVRERPSFFAQSTETAPDAAAPVSSAVRQSGQTSGPGVDDGGVGDHVNAKVRLEHRGTSDARMSIDRSRQPRTSVCQSQRKARRCWSPELHHRFVSALQQLGGPQVATPKQIREVMKVDNLTNDEVKSHLQKYRLHTRRPSPSPGSSPSPHAPQLVVLGWMRPDQFQAAVGAASQASTGGVCDEPPLVITQKYTPPQPTEQPQPQPLPVLQKHLPAISQTSLQGSPSGTGATPNSSSDSYLDEGDDVQERNAMSFGHSERQLEGKEQQQLQSAVESKGSTTSLVDIGNSSHLKLHTSRKTKAAA